jgi:hypothetical protein
LHLAQQKALAVAILLEGIVIYILIVVFTYYAVQAEANMKLDSPWKWRLDATWKEAWQRYKARGYLRAIPPNSEFTELGYGTVGDGPGVGAYLICPEGTASCPEIESLRAWLNNVARARP